MKTFLMFLFLFGTKAVPIVYAASNPHPDYAIQTADLNTTLEWTGATNPVTGYNVYFSTNDFGTATTTTLAQAAFRGVQTGTDYVPGMLATNTRYYWRIDTVATNGAVTTGNRWHFTTVGKIPGTDSLINMLPNSPTNYLLRDWSAVSRQYINLVTNMNASGQYLPISKWEANINKLDYMVNLPWIPSFVGIGKGGDALNMMPTVIAAKLSGIELGTNWVNAMMHFQGCVTNRMTLSNNTYKESSTGFWYEVLPSLYFNQLAGLYDGALATNRIAYRWEPGSNTMENVMYESSYRWYECCRDYLRTTNPVASNSLDKIYYTVNFNTVTGERGFRTEVVTNNGVVTTNYTHDGVWECAAGLAWIQYTAFMKFTNTDFIAGTEWALNFLATAPKNPMHNGTMMGYGTLVMARMNAELGYNWDTDQMFRWTFGEGATNGAAGDDDDAGPARAGWGVLYSNYGPYEVSGLIGSEGARGGANRAYAKQGYHLAAAFAPLVRYDSRYARPVGKWLLHLASSSRNYYQTYVADQYRDSPFFNADTNGVVPFESLRGYQSQAYFQQYLTFMTNSPTANTNVLPRIISAVTNLPVMWASGRSGPVDGGLGLALYFGGDVGYLGAIVTNTTQDKIIQLDLLKTDFYRDAAYPTYLYYNPWTSAKTVQINVGTNLMDIYDTVIHNYVTNDVTGLQTISISADTARVLVLIPAGGSVTYSGRKRLVNDIVMDYYYPVKARLFSDGFESGSFVLSGWTTSNTLAEAKTEAKYTGSYGAKLYKTTWMQKMISTKGYQGVYVKYRRSTTGYDAGDNLYVEWSVDGTNWNNLETVQNASFSDGLKNIRCIGADDNSGFRIRFRSTATENGETAYIDDVEVVSSY